MEKKYMSELCDEAWSEGWEAGVYNERLDCLERFMSLCEIPKNPKTDYVSHIPLPKVSFMRIDDSLEVTPEKVREMEKTYVSMKCTEQLDELRRQAEEQGRFDERVRNIQAMNRKCSLEWIWEFYGMSYDEANEYITGIIKEKLKNDL